VISGRERHPASACFDEINRAVQILSPYRNIVFNAHAFPVPPRPGTVIYNFENMPPVDPSIYVGHEEIWDFSQRNAERQGYTYVPVGYHPSFERFEPAEHQDIDVAFFGSLNERRLMVIHQMRVLGLNVRVLDQTCGFGYERDAILARTKLVLNMLYYPDGNFPVLRAAHCIANKVSVLNEACEGVPEWIDSALVYPYNDLASAALHLVKDEAWRFGCTRSSYEAFRKHPLALPEPTKKDRMIEHPSTRWEIINHIAQKIGAKRYLEIGVDNGSCMRQIQIPEKWGVDPAPQVEGVTAATVFVPKTSDDFFETVAPQAGLFDIVFIDGLHHAEQVYRDVQNSLKILSPKGVIVLHDCNPSTEGMQIVPMIQGEWTGDVWKTIVRLRQDGLWRDRISVVSSDYGVGVIVPPRPGPQGLTGPWMGARPPQHKAPPQLAWSDLEADRQALLGLHEPSEWPAWFEAQNQ